MVDVVLKGTKKDRSYEIITFKASVVLKVGGGVIITITDRMLSKKLQECIK